MKKNRKIRHLKYLLLLLVFGYSISTNAYANTKITINIPASIDILEVDGSPYQSPSLVDGSYNIQLDEGEHTLVAQYYENWNTVDEAGNIIKWQPVLIKHLFVNTNNYSLKHIALRDSEHAETFISNPKIWLESENQRLAESTIFLDEKDSSSYQEKHIRNSENLKSPSSKPIVSFEQWQEIKRTNTQDYKKFLEYVEYQQYLQFLEYQNSKRAK